jgi:hypothetical protein
MSARAEIHYRARHLDLEEAKEKERGGFSYGKRKRKVYEWDSDGGGAHE